MGQAVARTAFAMAALTLPGAHAMAQEAPKLVEVKGMRDPQMQTYRGVAAGLDAFDKYRALAPRAGPLRFRVRPRADNHGASIAGITLDIVGRRVMTPVAIATDGLFTIERDQMAYEDKADLVFNHKRYLFTAFAEVRTPGLPDHVRRVGDLRLECQVNVAIVKTEIPLFIHVMANTVFGGGDWCDKIGIYRSVPSAGLTKATLVHGAHRKDFSLRDIRDTIKIPELDWPDDTLLELDYATVNPAVLATAPTK